MSRRALLGIAASAAAPAAARFEKGICWSAFPAGTPYAECMRQAREAGFAAIELRIEPRGEIDPGRSSADLRPLADTAERLGIAVASLWALTPSSPSLASPDPATRESALALARAAVRLAPAVGAGAVLVTPGVLGRGPRMEVTHDNAWRRATEAYRELLPAAAAARVMLTPENVWSKFLVSPRDMREFLDQFHSPWVKAHFDTGNVMQFGYPEDWILTLGDRIRRVHFKDYKLSTRGSQGQFVPLLAGDVQWKDVMASLVRIGYRGWVSAETGPDASDPRHLLKISQAMDRILAMA